MSRPTKQSTLYIENLTETSLLVKVVFYRSFEQQKIARQYHLEPDKREKFPFKFTGPASISAETIMGPAVWAPEKIDAGYKGEDVLYTFVPAS